MANGIDLKFDGERNLKRSIKFEKGTNIIIIMKTVKINLRYLLVLLIGVMSTSCEYGRQAEEQMKKFNTQVKDLDSMVNEGIEKVSDIDSILPKTSKRLKEADTLIKDAASTLDSLKQKVRDIENILN